MFLRDRLPLIFIASLFVWIAASPLSASQPGDKLIYTSEEDIEFAQSILDHEGYLERGDYTVGRRDGATSNAIADFQRRHNLNGSGRLDFDTMAMLTSHEPAAVAMARTVPPVPPPPPAAAPRAAAAPPPPPAVEAPPEPPAPVVVAAMDDDLEMPATAGPVPLLALSGGLLAGLGLLITMRRSG